MPSKSLPGHWSRYGRGDISRLETVGRIREPPTQKPRWLRRTNTVHSNTDMYDTMAMGLLVAVGDGTYFGCPVD